MIFQSTLLTSQIPKRKIIANIERYVKEGTDVDEVDWENMPKRENREPAPKYKSTPEEKKIFISGFAWET